MAKMLSYRIINIANDDIIADIYYDVATQEYSADLISHSIDLPVMFGFPVSGTVPNPSSECIEAFLKSRVVPPTRMFIRETLQNMGIWEYDWRVLIALNKGDIGTDSFRVLSYLSLDNTVPLLEGIEPL